MRGQRNLPAWVSVVLLLTSMTSVRCMVTPSTVGPTPTEGGRKLDELLASAQRTYTDVELSRSVIMVSEKLDRSTLAPSGAYSDSSMWITSEGKVRRFTVTGSFLGDHYIVNLDTAPPVDLGASRREIRLERLTRRDFRWRTSIEQTLGSIATGDLDRATGAMLAEAAVTPGHALHAIARTRYPRAATALGQLFSLDSTETRQLRGSSTHIRLVIGVHIDRLAAAYPAYANVLSRVVTPSRLHCMVTDADNTKWAQMDFDGVHLSMELATTRDGHFAPLVGAPRPMPDSLILHADLSTKVSVFSIGIRDLSTEVEILHPEHARGWRFTFRQEPTWDFPLALDRLVESSLARPFADSGAQYEIVVSDSLGPRTILQRRGVLIVEESPIMTVLAQLASDVTTSFSGTALAEENAFFASVLAAIRMDVQKQSRIVSDGLIARMPSGGR